MNKIQIAKENLEFMPLPEPVPAPLTGDLIAKLAGADNPKNYIVIQWRKNGLLQVIGPDEKPESDGGADLKFILFRSSMTYKFELDGNHMIWGARVIRGDVLKKLVGVEPNHFSVWQQSNTGDDRLIEDNELADLTDAGEEKFFTAAKESTEGISL